MGRQISELAKVLGMATLLVDLRNDVNYKIIKSVITLPHKTCCFYSSAHIILYPSTQTVMGNFHP